MAGNDNSPSHPLPVIQASLQALSKAADAAASAQSFPCAPRCSFCCHRQIPASGPEVELVARFIRQQAPEKQAQLRDRVEATASAIRSIVDPAQLAAHAEQTIAGLTVLSGALQSAHPELKCPFVENGSGRALCLIYEVRPLECRLHYAMGPDACARPHARVPMLDGRGARLRTYQELKLAPVTLLALGVQDALKVRLVGG